MLSNLQRRTIALCVVLAGMVIAVCLRWGPSPLPALSLAPAPVHFQGASAYEYTRVVAEEFPDRITGTSAARQAALYIGSQLKNLGYSVTFQTFPLWLRGTHVQGMNIIAALPGESPESVAFLAHYDSQFTSHQAAEDNASGVGVLLELARALRLAPHRQGIILVATDAGEWGMIGGREAAPIFEADTPVF